jgi:hypothetical protein
MVASLLSQPLIDAFVVAADPFRMGRRAMSPSGCGAGARSRLSQKSLFLLGFLSTNRENVDTHHKEIANGLRLPKTLLK